MTITIDWEGKTVSVHKVDMTLVQSYPKEIYELDIDEFRLALKNLEDSEEGMTFPDTHRHNTEVTLGGVILARVVEMINGYTITFEDGQYAVNLVGANSNIADVTNVNQVSVRSANSAGLQTVVSGSGVTEQDKQDIIGPINENVDDLSYQIYETQGQVAEVQGQAAKIELHHIKRRKIEGDYLSYYDDNDTLLAKYKLVKDAEGRIIERIPQAI